MKKIISLLGISILVFSPIAITKLVVDNKTNNIFTFNSKTNTQTSDQVKKQEIKQLDSIITQKMLGDILNTTKEDVITAINRKNSAANIDVDTKDLEVVFDTKEKDKKAKIKAITKSTKYSGEIEVSFAKNPNAKFKLDELIIVKDAKHIKAKSTSDEDIIKAVSQANKNTTTPLNLKELDLTFITTRTPDQKENYKVTIKPKPNAKHYQNGAVEVAITIDSSLPNRTTIIIAATISSIALLGGATLLIINKQKVNNHSSRTKKPSKN
ncbi:hypothetical protein [Mycoplasma putrefaciens]|uniref:Uncharacterized protein n=1 Tax=Mycoplasma putrefaciens Mput9231 TaxID=1292033 RepID=M9WBR6_9MOLU|nr:hypothetical protein [Mycoplasma putrefaciens]AGJ90597.1 Hypothetical protein, predicted transmembrane protein [Mycoplasma putrefaciens Mput9231]